MPSAPGKNGKIRKLTGSVTRCGTESLYNQVRYCSKLSRMLSTRPSLPYCFSAYPAELNGCSAWVSGSVPSPAEVCALTHAPGNAATSSSTSSG